MHGKKYEDAKKEIRSVLLTYKDRVPLNEFLKTYRNLLGQRLPSKDLGFKTDVEFLMSMPDVVDVKSNSDNTVYLSGIADKTSSHIQKLVRKQRTAKSNSNKRDVRQPTRKLLRTVPAARELKPFLPGTLRAEILELMSSHHSLTLSSFALAYHRKFKKFLPLINGLNSLEGMIKLIPELEVEKNEHNEIVVYNKKHLKAAEGQKESSGKNTSPSKMTTGKNDVQKKSSFDIHESGISEDILSEFQMVLQQFPNGIMNILFPILYEKVTKKPFDIVELGYTCLADLVEVLPHIFKRVSNPDNEQHWYIYPADSHIEENSEAKQTIDNFSRMHLEQREENVSAGVSSPNLQYIESSIPNYINLNEYIPIYVSAILSPSLFWFQLQTPEFVEKFNKLEKDLSNFYSYAYDEYKMKKSDLAVGATCVIQLPDDNQYYRAIIKGIPSSDLVNVSFVDYGSRDNVPRSNVHYVWSKLHEYPAFAFQAELAGLKPAKNADTWSKEARKKFVELCNCSPLMALINSVDEDNYSVSLCDTTKDEDIYFYDILINEGHAESSHQNIDFNKSNLNDFEKISNGHNIPVDSDSSSANNEDFLLSDNSDMSVSDSNKFPVNRKLSFSSDVENCVPLSNTSVFNENKHAKRYVKQIELCKGTNIHLINLEMKLFIPCGELCSLLWSEKDTNFLIRRLKDNEIEIPFVHVKKEDCIELFEQCLWYKVTDFQNRNSDYSSLILCPLEKAFDVLNIFGHPSICLRIIIQHEVRTFDPHDEFWNEIPFQEFTELNAVESEILEDINKLCLYDLKAKYEAFKIQKLKYQRHHSNPSIEEIKRIENILNILTRKIKQIETICVQYSSCS